MKSLFKNISIYAFGDIIHKSIQFLLLPLYTNLLSPGTFGELEFVYMVGSILVILNGLLIQNGYARFYFDSNDIKSRKLVFGTSFLFIFSTSFLVLLICLNFASEISSFIFDSSDGEQYIKLIAISTVIGSIYTLLDKNLIVRQKAKSYVIINIIDSIITISLTIYFVVILNLSVIGILQAQIIGRVFRLVMLLFVTYSEIGLLFSFSILKKMLYFSIFLIPSEISSFIAYMSNRIFINDYSDLTQVGVFSLGYKIASITPILITGPIKKAFKPHIFSLITNEKKLKQEFSVFIKIYSVITILFIFVLSLFSRELISIMADESFLLSYKVIFPLSIGYFIIGLSALINTGLAVKKKTWIFGYAWIICAILNLLLNYLLVPIYGNMGAAYSTTLSFFSVLIIYAVYLDKIFPVKINYLQIFYLLLTSFLFYSILEIFVLSFFYLIFIKFLILSLFILLIWFGGFLNKKEKLFFKNLIRKKSSIK
ncbi:MAG: hypothetical protein CMJ05_01525 [Pelagibacterales bacterium]|nr:hypothetical protein [Pelagibacterales bacterium]|tara:strand:- start:18937 stop:20385 length:1449 start_codon:yes stop_codon:yes gene_type:complete